ncbi:MAG: tryptophan-rich sensory protein [Anaeromicrobium sp.]|uniref:TspO/MBR family protein n=1 Tax=Anaeromicrobium sp. TaxID=1929132 RepID=UPI0025FAE11A|nr:TspO/MBR family protein [Anaeromicrobium sp.]MCT4594605.1 tryptophan-rich sensory protein [Anaeromicrobium sp.]
MKGRTNYFAAFVSIFIAQMTGLLSSYFTRGSMGSFYAELKKPAFAPPPWVFGVVWPILYLLMGIASYRIWMSNKYDNGNKKALFYYGLQLFVNFTWSIIFFGMENIGLSVIAIIILLGLIIITIKEFSKIDKKAASLMIPYLIWVVFATILNISIWIMNM